MATKIMYSLNGMCLVVSRPIKKKNNNNNNNIYNQNFNSDNATKSCINGHQSVSQLFASTEFRLYAKRLLIGLFDLNENGSFGGLFDHAVRYTG